MKEIVFLKQNSEKWKRFEAIIKKPNNAHPDEIADMFIHLTDDLSYARTHFQDSKTERFLNSLTARFHQAIYKTKKENKSRLISFWKDEQPVLLYKYRKYLIYSFVIFLISIFAGTVSLYQDKAFATLILGESYIKMTLENIDKGDPIAVYKSMNSIDMFLGITINNIIVALYAFAMGIFLSFGTGYILFRNGIMIGVFHYFFYEKGLLGASMLSIWLHGTLEISVILVAGCAGLVLGNSILFPKTFTREHSLKKGAKDGLKIVIGTVPIFFVAGAIEGFVTRFTSMPMWLSLLIIISSFSFILWFYFIYPHYYNKKREVS
jgi:uncharacterized membrane protein SpoIIM required for sporulation